MPQDYLTVSLPEVLVADDDEAIRETIRYILEESGYSVREAADGVEALAILRRSPRPRVVLLDLMMPRLDGVSVLRAVTSDPELAHQHRFILVSANLATFASSLSALLSQTDAEVLAKPFDIDALLDSVNRAARQLRPSVAGSLGAALDALHHESSLA